MKKIYMILLLLCYLVASPTFAQRELKASYNIEKEPAFKPEYFAVGIRVGMSMTSLRGLDKMSIPGLHIDQQIAPYSTNIIFHADVGLTGQVMFHNQLLMQLDVGMVGVGAELDDGGYPPYRMEGYNFQTRLLLGSKIRIGEIEGFNFVYGAGPFLNIAFGRGEGEIDWYDYDEGVLSMSELDLKTIDYGLSGMLGLEYYGWQFAVHYDHGLQNLAYEEKMKTSGLHFGVSYVFGF